MSRSLRLAIFCAVTPLLIGTMIYLAFVLTGQTFLIALGLWTVFGGLFSVAAGFAFLVCHLQEESRHPTSRYSIRAQALAVSALLLLNFPAAARYVVCAIDLESRYSVTVVNAGSELLEDGLIHGPAFTVEYGSIPPGSEMRKSFHVRGTGPLEFVALQGQIEISGEVDGYVCTGLGGESIVQVLPNGTLRVEQGSN